jgi:hypothetical protein
MLLPSAAVSLLDVGISKVGLQDQPKSKVCDGSDQAGTRKVTWRPFVAGFL